MGLLPVDAEVLERGVVGAEVAASGLLELVLDLNRELVDEVFVELFQGDRRLALLRALSG